MLVFAADRPRVLLEESDNFMERIPTEKYSCEHRGSPRPAQRGVEESPEENGGNVRWIDR